MAKIYLDAGHGGKDGGASSGKRKEKDDVLKMTLAVGKRLTERGVSVKYARTDDTEKKLNDRTAESNAWGAQYYLSIHRNSASPDATGNEIWVKSDATEKTVEKAAKILRAACEADGLRNRGVKKGAPSYTDFAVNKYTKCASGLLELGFITSTKDNTAWDRSFDKTADAIAKSLCEIVGVPWNKERRKGDVNGDGKVTTADARLALRAATALEKLTEEAEEAADMNNDGKVTTSDAREILREATKLDS